MTDTNFQRTSYELEKRRQRVSAIAYKLYREFPDLAVADMPQEPLDSAVALFGLTMDDELLGEIQADVDSLAKRLSKRALSQ